MGISICDRGRESTGVLLPVDWACEAKAHIIKRERKPILIVLPGLLSNINLGIFI